MKDLLDKLSELEQIPAPAQKKSIFEGSILRELETKPHLPESQLERELLAVMEETDNVNEAGFWTGVGRALGNLPTAAMGAIRNPLAMRGGISAAIGAREGKRLLNILYSEGMREYGEYRNNIRKTEGRDPTADEAVDWANNVYKNDGFDFPTAPKDGSISSVAAWLKDQLRRNQAAAATRAPSIPQEPEKFVNFPQGPVTIRGSSGNTYTYDPADPGKWKDQTGREYVLPADAAIIDRLNSAPAAQAAKATPAISGVAPFPTTNTTINTTRGPYIFTNAMGGTWNWYKAPPAGTALTGTAPETDPNLINALNDIAQQQARATP